MKKIQLRQLIRETIKESLNENISNEIDIFNQMKSNSTSPTFSKMKDVTEEDLFDEKRFSKKDPGIYLVGETGDYGKMEDAIGYYKADSRRHARLRAAIGRENIEIYLSGGYDSKKIKEEDIEKEINDLEKKLAILKRVL
jgi:hypothetical protein